MTELRVYAVLLVALMVGAYQSWHHQEEKGSTDEVVLMKVEVEDLQDIYLATKTQTVAVSFKEAGAQRYAWFEVKNGRGMRYFAGNEAFDRHLESFLPLRALRSLGKSLQGEELKSTKLDSSGKKMRLKTANLEKNYRLGGRTSGARDYYLQAEGSKEVFLVKGKLVADLEFPAGRFMQRRMRQEPLKEVEELQVSFADTMVRIKQQNRLSSKDAYWAPAETPDKKDETLGNYAEKLDRLSAIEYLKPDQQLPEGSQLLLEATWLGEKDKQLAKMSLHRHGTGKTADFYAISTVTHHPVKVSRFAAEQLENDLKLLKGK